MCGLIHRPEPLASAPITQGAAARISLVGKSRKSLLATKTPETFALTRSGFLDTRRAAMRPHARKAAKYGGLHVSPWFAPAHQKAGRFPSLGRPAVFMRVFMPPGLGGKAKPLRGAFGGLAPAPGAAWLIRATAAPARQGRQRPQDHEQATKPRITKRPNCY